MKAPEVDVLLPARRALGSAARRISGLARRVADRALTLVVRLLVLLRLVPSATPARAIGSAPTWVARRPAPSARHGKAADAVARSRVLVIEPETGGGLPAEPSCGDRLDAELHVVARVSTALDVDHVDRLLRRHRPRSVLSKRSLDSMDAAFLAVCDRHDVAIYVLAHPSYGLMRPVRWHRFGGLPWLQLRHSGQRRREVAKRVFDVVAVLLSAPLTVPLMAVIMVALLASGSPIFVQERVGAGGRCFRMFKFRSMLVGAETATGPVLCATDDARVTPFGRRLRQLRLDELPQLWNVLRGDMSLVGPRPERPEFVTELRAIPHYDRRHLIRPGLTGIAQLTGGYAATAEEKLRCDLLYVNSRSLRSDLVLLLLTASELLRGFPRG